MYTKHFFTTLLCALLTICQTYAASSARVVENLNREWKFALGDYPQASMPKFNDSHWETIGLPHSFSIPYFMSNDFYVGYGWYRKQLTLSTKDLQKAIFLEFDGVFQEAEIYVNGLLTGKHVGGYTGFNIDGTIHTHTIHTRFTCRHIQRGNTWHRSKLTRLRNRRNNYALILPL